MPCFVTVTFKTTFLMGNIRDGSMTAKDSDSRGKQNDRPIDGGLRWSLETNMQQVTGEANGCRHSLTGRYMRESHRTVETQHPTDNIEI